MHARTQIRAVHPTHTCAAGSCNVMSPHTLGSFITALLSGPYHDTTQKFTAAVPCTMLSYYRTRPRLSQQYILPKKADSQQICLDSCYAVSSQQPIPTGVFITAVHNTQSDSRLLLCIAAKPPELRRLRSCSNQANTPRHSSNTKNASSLFCGITQNDPLTARAHRALWKAGTLHGAPKGHIQPTKLHERNVAPCGTFPRTVRTSLVEFRLNSEL